MEVNGKDDIPYIMENKTCSKPPTRILTCQFGWNSDRHTSVWRCCYAWINWILLRAFSGCIEHYSRLVYYLVGGFNPFEKYESQLGWLFPINGNSSSIHVPVTTNQLLYSFWFSWTNSFRIIPQQYYVLYGEKLEKSFINVGWCGILWSHWSRGYIIEAASRCYSILAHFIGLVSAEASACWAQWQWRYMKNLDNALEFMRSTHRLRSIFVGFEELIPHYAIFQ